jgi:alkylation response protein AidB-like acyl-CoA dehydrogenase
VPAAGGQGPDARISQEFYDATAGGGWLGMTIPEEYGGHGLGITEATLLLEESPAR